jgi:hypothetical protein
LWGRLLKKGIYIFFEHSHAVEKLSEKQRALIAVCLFNGKEESGDPMVDIILSYIFTTDKRHDEFVSQLSKTRAELGKKGGLEKARKLKLKLAKLAKGSKDKQSYLPSPSPSPSPDPSLFPNQEEEKDKIVSKDTTPQKAERTPGQQAVDYFCLAYGIKYTGTVYAPDWGKDVSLMKKLLEVPGITLEIVKNKIDIFFKMEMDWVKGHRDLGLFKTQFNKISDKVKTKKNKFEPKNEEELPEYERAFNKNR